MHATATMETSADEFELLREYARSRSESAFAGLVERYVDLVHSAARRQVGGDAEMAKDVVQAVFLVLAEKAGSLKADGGRSLAGWLLQVTRYAAANARRRSARRDYHERRAGEMARRAAEGDQGSAWDEYSPLLDEGIGKLRAKDRDAIVLRYFERKDTRAVAAALGISEAAAEKRVSRAVEKLRAFFRRRGVAVSAVVLASGMLAHSAEAAPAGLGLSVVSASSGAVGAAAATTATTTSVIAKGTVAAMAVAANTKLVVTGAVAAILLLGSGTVAVKTFSGPAKRQVDVSKQLAGEDAAALAAAQAQRPSPWSFTFADGTRVELVAVTASPDRPGGKWWGADGSPVQAPQPLPRLRAQFDAPGHSVYQFVLRQLGTGAADAQVGVGLGVPTAGSASSSSAESRATGARGPRLLTLMSALPANLTSVDVTLNCASGPWSLDWRYDVKEPRNPVATQPAGMTIGKVSDGDQPGRTLIEIEQDRAAYPEDRESRLVVLTAGGKEVGATSMTSSAFAPDVYEFIAPRKDVVALARLSRPNQNGVIRNVSLRPVGNLQVNSSTQPSTSSRQ